MLVGTEGPEPVLVSVTLDEAAHIVLGWLDPRRDPRIEAVKYVRRSALFPALRHAGLGGPQWFVLFAYRRATPASSFPPTVVAVVATTRGIGMMGRPTPEPRAGYCWSVGEHGRETVFIVLDATTGEPLVSTLVTAAPGRRAARASIIDWLTRQRSLDTALQPRDPHTEVTPTPSDGPSWTPEPTPTRPVGVPTLTSSNILSALQATFDGYPLRPGTEREWRVTSRVGGVKWTSSVVTEIVTVGWALGPELVLVEAEVTERQVLAPSTALGEPVVHTLRRVVMPDRIYGSVPARTPMPWPAPRSERSRTREHPDLGGIAVEPAIDPLTMKGRDGGGLVFQGSPEESVAVPAGDFDNCQLIEVVGSAGSGTQRWFCRGVGYVRSEFRACQGMSFEVTTTELVRWRVPAW